jgi:hypothetical protein
MKTAYFRGQITPNGHIAVPPEIASQVPPGEGSLPYDDYGLVTIAAIHGSGVAQLVATASYDGSTSGLVPGDFVFLEFGLSNEEHVNVISVDTVNQTFTAIVTKNHPAGSSIRPSIWRVRYQGGCFARSGF